MWLKDKLLATVMFIPGIPLNMMRTSKRYPLLIGINLPVLLVFTISFLLLALNKTEAQTKFNELKLDSLITANEHYQKQDLTKLELINTLAFAYIGNNPNKGIQAGEQAIALAQKLNNQTLLAIAYNNKGLNHDAKSEYPTALELFEKALVINQNLKNTLGIANSTFNIGNTYFLKGDRKKSKPYFEEALKLYEQINNKPGIAKVFIGLGSVYSSNEPTKALEFYQKALAINEQLGYKKGMETVLGNMGIVYSDQSNNTKALEYHQKSLAIAEQLGDKNSIGRHLSNIGSCYRSLSDYAKSLEYHQKSLAINEQLGNKSGMGYNLGNMGNVYSDLSDSGHSLEYLHKAVAIFEQLGDKNSLARNLGNIGRVYRKLSDNTKGLAYYQKALAICEEIGDKSGMAYNLGNIGNVYCDLNDYSRGIKNIQKALAIFEQLGDKKNIARNLGNIGTFYCKAPDSVLLNIGIKPAERFTKALEYQNTELKIGQEIGLISLQILAYYSISNTYEMQGDYAKAHQAYKTYITFRDSVESGEVKVKIERQTLQYEFDKKETTFKFEQALSQEKLLRSKQEITLSKQQLQLSNKEKDLQHLAYLAEKADKEKQENLLRLSEKEKLLQQAKLNEVSKEKEIQDKQLALSQAEVQNKNQQRNAFIVGSILLFLLAGAIFIGLRKTAKEKQRSENLLLNILPAEVAEELKQTGSSEAKLYNNVSVLFTDFVNFTGISEQMTPTQLVQELQENFTAFDAIMEKHGIEKIKTIGDAYLAVCGLPNEVADHAQRITKAALEIQQFIQSKGGKFQVRMGIHSGAVVAGIVGVKKFAYDIWGDTVNTAARIENNSEAGKINISQATYELIKDEFTCAYRGKITAKGKGDIDMYFVETVS